MMHLIAAYLPLVVLIGLMGKKNSMASSRALPLCAVMAWWLSLTVFDQNLRELNATVASGMLLALTPLSIIAGAIFLFRTMDVTGALDTIRTWLNQISHNPIAQLMIVGWAFAFLVEGASGFGTPAAIAAPVLYGLGFPALRVAVFCLIMNTIPVTFGAVGTPIWFGFSVLELTPQALHAIAWKAALVNTLAAPFIVIAGLALVLEERRAILSNLVFILLSTFACTLPYLLLSTISVEFPALAGGAIGLFITLMLARRGIGLAREHNRPSPTGAIAPRTLIKATFPLWGTVLVLILTRIHQLGLKQLLQRDHPALHVSLGPLGDLHLSAALVVSLDDIFLTDVAWQHSLLYVPSLVPFILIALLTLIWFRSSATRQVARQTFDSLRAPFPALLGALVFVNVMMLGGEASPVARIGHHLAGLSGQNWPLLAPILGALGSFFSGSATISNLTFAAIQSSIATQSGLDPTSILALQGVGAAMGNMVCINNIVAVTSILALKHQDGVILRKTALVLILYATIAGLAGALLLPHV
ncbi:L-lactate permease [Larsenimonas rhizosphaerae]|uniref:L-lactate permease n=1 Tax=Larsenimonas rhizosphaerae TaxID=2944682 RepID=A0AA42CVC0_9GAMM|nr:L-lactate permease [Larsenimonas rhizosphaerae]MCX2525244.1 L-lactate permease [Larsenimonas rhizosphaerae]